jgi:non-structural maintenance of chromosomes element 1
MSKKSSLNDAEQYLLQQFLNNSVLDQFNFKDLFRSVLNKFNIKYNTADNEQLKLLIVQYLKSINEAIKQYSLEIKIGTCELTGITFYCLVRLFDSHIGAISQLYNQNELKFFKKILNLIIESDDALVDFSSIVTALADDDLKFSNKEVREATDKFVADYWLIAISGNRFALHSRTILELTDYLIDVYGERSPQNLLINCKLCKEIVISGIACESCTSKMHRHCAKRYYKTQNDCISCKKPMTEEQLSLLRESNKSSQNATQSSSQRDVKNVSLINNTQGSADGSRRRK